MSLALLAVSLLSAPASVAAPANPVLIEFLASRGQPYAPLIPAVRWVTDDRIVVVHDQQMALHRHDGPTLWTAPGPRTTVRDAVVRPDLDALFVGTQEGGVHRYRLTDGAHVTTLPGALDGWVMSVAVSPDGREVAAVTLQGDLRWWRDGEVVMAGQPKTEGGLRFGRPEDAAFTPDGHLAVAGAGARGSDLISLAVWARDGRLVAAHIPPPMGRPGAGGAAPWSYGQALSFSPDGAAVAVGYWGGGLEVLAWPSLVPRWRSEPNESWIDRICWTPDGGRLWTVSGRELQVHRAADGAWASVVRNEPNHTADGLDLSPDGRRVIITPRFRGVVTVVDAHHPVVWSPPRLGQPVKVAPPVEVAPRQPPAGAPLKIATPPNRR